MAYAVFVSFNLLASGWLTLILLVFIHDFSAGGWLSRFC